MTGKSTTRAQQRRQARRAIKDTDLKAIGSGKIKDVYRSHGSRALLKPGAAVDSAKMTRVERAAMAADLAAAGVHQIESMPAIGCRRLAEIEGLLKAASERPMTMAEKSVVVTMLREAHCSDDEILRVLAVTSARKIRRLTVAIRRADRERAEAVRVAIEEALK